MNGFRERDGLQRVIVHLLAERSCLGQRHIAERNSLYEKQRSDEDTLNQRIIYYLDRLRKIDEKPKTGHTAASERDLQADGSPPLEKIPSDPNTRNHLNIKVEVIPKVEHILQMYGHPIKANKIAFMLEHQFGIAYRNISSLMKQVMKENSSIQKIERGLYVFRNENLNE